MLSSRFRLAVPAILSLAAALSGQAKADFIGDTVTITSDSSFSDDPTTIDVLVTTGVELPNGFGSSATLSYQTAIDIQATSVEIDVLAFFAVGFTPFQGLRFTGLDSPGERITGFTVESTIGGVSGTFLASAITFGDNFLNVALQNGPAVGQAYAAGDQIRVTLQLSPSAVPEPASLATLGIGVIGLSGYGWRRRRRMR